MRISVVRRGTFAEAPRSVTVDDAQLPDELLPSLRALSELAAASARSRPRTVLRSQPHYAITLVGDHGPQLLTLYESQVPPKVQPLIDVLMRYAR